MRTKISDRIDLAPPPDHGYLAPRGHNLNRSSLREPADRPNVNADSPPAPQARGRRRGSAILRPARVADTRSGNVALGSARTCVLSFILGLPQSHRSHGRFEQIPSHANLMAVPYQYIPGHRSNCAANLTQSIEGPRSHLRTRAG